MAVRQAVGGQPGPVFRFDGDLFTGSEPGRSPFSDRIEPASLRIPDVRVLRQWTGICDMTPDYSPIMGEVPGIRGFYLDVGWGTYGFKAGPVAGRRMAELIATGRAPDLIKPFSLTRFQEDRLVGEKAAAAVSH